MNKFIGLFALVLGLGLFGASSSEAASGVRGGKAYVSNNYSTAVSTVSAKSATLYSVIVGTGAAGDYTALFDLASGVTIPSASSNLSKMRIYASSTTQNTLVTFDPPLIFLNGIQGVNSAVGLSATYVFEAGRVTQGY